MIIFFQNNLYRHFFVVFSLILCLFFGDVFAAQKRPITDKLWYDLDKYDKELLQKISIYIESGKYDLALKKVNLLHKNYQNQKNQFNPFRVRKTGFKSALKNLILWHKFSDQTIIKGDSTPNQNISFNDISRFIEDNPFYPNIEKLRLRAEFIATNQEIPYRLSQQYFLSNPPSDLESKLYLIKSKSEFLLRIKDQVQKEKMAQEISEMIVDVWINENFDQEKEKEILESYQDYLTVTDHQNRIDRLLWDSRFEDAERIFKFVGRDYIRLYKAIIKIRKLPRYINHILFSVPRKLRSDNNLLYSRILWYKSRGEMDDIVDLLLKVGEVKYPHRWWNMRRLYGRELLKTKDYKDSYKIISNHQIKPREKDHWEAAWMSGWIALRFLDEPEQAYQHFLELYHNVKQPVSLARASYWLGMAALAKDDKEKALEWYKIASQYPLYFYGQLAIHKARKLDPLNQTQEIILPKDPDITVGDARNIAKNEGAKIAYLLALMGDKSNSIKIFSNQVMNADSEGEIAVLMRIVNDLRDPEMNAFIARIAAKKNVFFIRDKFQLVKEVDEDSEYSALVHAIIKQESGFNVSAVSSAGAIGFMQIMPDTARRVAKDLGIRYSRYKLGNNVAYNVKLGSHYIKQMVDRFEGSEMLAIAAYNAGPHNADRWIREFYDPREVEIDEVVDWIELITYSETRNYVQRIMENLIVYKYLMRDS